MTLENCILRGSFIADGAKTDGENVGSWKGFYVAPNSKLILKQCNVINFDVGLRVRSSGQVIASASEITMCNIGILVRYFVNVKMITLLYFRPPPYAGRREYIKPDQQLRCEAVQRIRNLCRNGFRFHRRNHVGRIRTAKLVS